MPGDVEVLGAGREGTADPSDVAVRLERETPVVSSIVELREGVLDERERAGLFGHVGGDLRNQGAVHAKARALRGTDDRSLELLGRQRTEDLGRRTEQWTDTQVPERTVEGVRTESGDHA